jgi:hypothetical protein
MEKRFHRRARQDENRENAESSPKRKKAALNAGKNEDEPIAHSMSDAATGVDDASGRSKTGQKHPDAHTTEKPSNENRWMFTRFTAHGLRRENHGETNREIDERKAGKERG